MNHNETKANMALSNTTRSVLQWDVHDTITPWIFAAVSFMISPITVLLNALVIIAIKKRRELRTLSNILLANMAVTDLLVGGICVPLSAIIRWLITSLSNSCWSAYLQVRRGNCLCHIHHVICFTCPSGNHGMDKSILTQGRLKKLAVIAWISSILCILTPHLISMVLRGETTFFPVDFSTACFLALIIYFYFMVFLKFENKKSLNFSRPAF